MTRRAIEILAFCIALLIAALAFHAWLSSHDDQLRLQFTIAAQKQILDAADARERDRNAALKDSLSQIAALKRQTQTPEQILRELPKYIRLPQPITLSPPTSAPASAGGTNDTSRAEDTSAQRNASSAASASASVDENRQGTHPSAKQGTTPSAKSFWRSLLHPGEKDGNSHSRDGFPMPSGPPRQSTSDVAAPASSVAGGSAEPNALSQFGAASSDSASANSASANSGDPTTILSDGPYGQDQSPLSPRSGTPAVPAAQDQPANSPSASVGAHIPAADLKPLYDFVQDCRACQLQLAAAKQDAADNSLKITALTRERDAALKSAKGGSFWLRLRRNSYWLAIGAAVAAGGLCASGHCR